MSLVILEPGIESRIVDLGRPHSRSLGVPVGGAADRRALMLGNTLLGNPPDAAALEIALKGPRLRADADVGCVISGAPFDAYGDSDRIAPGHTFTLRAGESLQIDGAGEGARAYLCVRGGFHVPAILGSRSALEPIREGDLLACEASAIHCRYCLESPSSYSQVRTITVVAGLQAGWFDDAEFYRQTLAISVASNRMGLRLKGEPLTMAACELVSEAVCPGAVQVTPDGQCIVLGVDGQTIGGYPKIAQVIQADLDMLGQLRPGQSIEFKKITLDEAIARDRQAQSELRYWIMRLRLSLDAFPAERKLQT